MEQFKLKFTKNNKAKKNYKAAAVIRQLRQLFRGASSQQGRTRSAGRFVQDKAPSTLITGRPVDQAAGTVTSVRFN